MQSDGGALGAADDTQEGMIMKKKLFVKPFAVTGRNGTTYHATVNGEHVEGPWAAVNAVYEEGKKAHAKAQREAKKAASAAPALSELDKFLQECNAVRSGQLAEIPNLRARSKQTGLALDRMHLTAEAADVEIVADGKELKVVPLHLPTSAQPQKAATNYTDAQREAVAQADAFLNNVGLPNYSAFRDALNLIGSQSIADDWTNEQACEFMRQHARNTVKGLRP